MDRKLSWPVALLAIGVVLLLLLALGARRMSGGGSEARLSPQFLRLSPAEQQEALKSAEAARRIRGGRP